VSGEPASYVRNIYKYYVTYQGLEKSRQAREKALDDQAMRGITSGSKLLIYVGLAICFFGAAAYWATKRFT
jgi:hypothetical protein